MMDTVEKVTEDVLTEGNINARQPQTEANQFPSIIHAIRTSPPREASFLYTASSSPRVENFIDSYSLL